MATQGGPRNGLLETFGMLFQMQQQAEQTKLAKKAAQTSQLNNFLQIIRQVDDPTEQTNLIRTYADLGAADESTLQQIAQNVAPTMEAQTSSLNFAGTQQIQGRQQPVNEAYGQLAQGAAFQTFTGGTQGRQVESQMQTNLLNQHYSSMSPEERGRVGRAAFTRAFTGMGPGDFATQSAVAELPSQQLARAAGIQTGTALNAGQVQQGEQFIQAQGQQAAQFAQQMLQNDQHFQQNLQYMIQTQGQEQALRWATLTQAEQHFKMQFGLSEAELGLALQKAQQDARSTRGGGMPFMEMVQQRTVLWNTLQDEKANMDPAERTATLNMYNGLDYLVTEQMRAALPDSARARQQGLNLQWTPLTIDQLGSTGWFGKNGVGR